MKNTQLVIMAAGLGSRFGGDKQITDVGPTGGYILDYSMYDAWRAGFGKVVLIIRPELEAPLKKHFGKVWDDKLDIAFVIQSKQDLPEGFSCPADRVKPWGTGHAIWCARKQVEGEFAVINADDYYGTQTYRVLADFFRSGKCNASSYAMVGFELSRTLTENGTVSRGLCDCTAEGFLKSVVEMHGIEPKGDAVIADDGNGGKCTLTGREVMSMNFWGFHSSLFAHLEAQLKEFLAAHGQEMKSEFYIPFVVDKLIHSNMANVTVLSSPEKWFGMTYKADLDVVRARLADLTAQGVYPSDICEE